jgi:hypothetical protein
MFGSNVGAKMLLGCHNWVRRWLIKDRRRQLVWVKPAHSKFNMPVLGRVMRHQVTVVKGLEAFDDFAIPVDETAVITAVHVCRSGCWTPPWTDAAFAGLIEDSELWPDVQPADLLLAYPMNCSSLAVNEHDPLTEREIPDGSRQIPRLDEDDRSFLCWARDIRST